MASGKGNNMSIGLLEMVFQAVQSADMANILENSSTSPITNLYVSLHNSSGPGAGGSQSTNETAYTNYLRVAVARTTGGWSISSETISNVGAVTFATCGASGDTLTYVGIGTASSGAGILLWFGALSSNLAVSNGITPSFAAGQLAISES